MNKYQEEKFRRSGYVPLNREKRVSLFQQGDKVSYNGQKHKGALGGKLGFIHAAVLNQEGVFSVDFPELKTDDRYYVLSERHLMPFRPSKKEDHERVQTVEVQRRRKRVAAEEES